MPQISTTQSRVIDPVLTEVARGYSNGEMVGMSLFPLVPVSQRGGRVVTFRREDFRAYNTARAPGTDTKRVQFGYDGSPFALDQHSLEGQVPFEHMQEAAAVPGIDMARLAVMKTQNIIANRLEIQQATIATTAASYAATNKVTLAGVSQWSDPAATPVNDIETAKEAIRKQAGRRPNTVILGAAVFAKLRTNPQIVDRIKYTGRDVATLELLAGLFGVQRVLSGDAIFLDASDTLQDVWGKFVVIAYTDLSGINDMGVPSYGYTYRLRDYPIAEQAYEDRGAKSWIYPVTDEVSPVMVGADAGYLISAAIA